MKQSLHKKRGPDLARQREPKAKPGANAPPSQREAPGAEGGLRVGVGGRCNKKKGDPARISKAFFEVR
jgi:hypothetical protein